METYSMISPESCILFVAMFCCIHNGFMNLCVTQVLATGLLICTLEREDNDNLEAICFPHKGTKMFCQQLGEIPGWCNTLGL